MLPRLLPFMARELLGRIDRQAARRFLALAAAAVAVLSAGRSSADEPSDDALQRAGIRRLESRHLRLYTDLPASPAVDRLPQDVDQAYPQWRRYFQADRDEDRDWKLTACLMRDPDRFRAAGLFPAAVPTFDHGYTIDERCWLYEQPSDYYRRHLLLHEGTHAFMFTRLGSCGPTWYMEGMAELLGTHGFDDDRLLLGVIPKNRDDVPMWGRIKMIEDARSQGGNVSLERLLELGPRELPDRLGYAWCWAAAAFLDGHPRYGERFRQLPSMVRSRDFNRRVRALYGDDWPAVCAEFALFLHDLDFGHDLQRTALDWTPGSPLEPDGRSVTIKADRGWQNTGVALEAGKTYELSASGRYVVARDPQPWWCEPGGVTLRYYRGRPLGELQAAVVPPPAESAKNPPWTEATPVGLHGTLTPSRSGTLYLRINDAPGELVDNEGEMLVRVRPLPTGSTTTDDTTVGSPN